MNSQQREVEEVSADIAKLVYELRKTLNRNEWAVDDERTIRGVIEKLEGCELDLDDVIL